MSIGPPIVPVSLLFAVPLARQSYCSIDLPGGIGKTKLIITANTGENSERRKLKPMTLGNNYIVPDSIHRGRGIPNTGAFGSGPLSPISFAKCPQFLET